MTLELEGYPNGPLLTLRKTPKSSTGHHPDRRCCHPVAGAEPLPGPSKMTTHNNLICGSHSASNPDAISLDYPLALHPTPKLSPAAGDHSSPWARPGVFSPVTRLLSEISPWGSSSTPRPTSPGTPLKVPTDFCSSKSRTGSGGSLLPPRIRPLLQQASPLPSSASSH